MLSLALVCQPCRESSIRAIHQDVDAMVNLDLIEQIYEVPLGNSTWDEVMLRIRREARAEQGVLFAIDQRSGLVDPLSVIDGDDSLWQEYRAYYHKLDPWRPLFEAGALPLEALVAGDKYVHYRQFVKSEYFQDWWIRNGIYYTAGGRFGIQDGRQMQLNLPRAKQHGSYQEGELTILSRYAGNVARALALEGAIPKAAAQPDFDAIAVRYRLSPAEARLLEVMADTGSLKRSADRLHRSYHTVRSQLRVILQKTETNSQVQLIRLIYTRKIGPVAE